MAWKDLSLKGEVVSFRATDGAVLSGMLSRPKGSTTVVLHLHGLHSGFHKPLSIKLGNIYAKNRIAFMSIQQRGSFTEYSMDVIRGNANMRVRAGSAFERFEDSVYDIAGAVKYLKSIGIKKVYLQGHSSGCNKSVYYIIKNRDRMIKGTILLAPGDDLNGWKSILGKKGYANAIKLAKSKMKKDQEFRMELEYPEIHYSARRFLSLADGKSIEARIFNYELPRMVEFSRVRVPVLAIFGERDEYAAKRPVRYLELLAENTSSANFTGVVLKGSTHGFFKKEAELGSVVGNWIMKRERGR